MRFIDKCYCWFAMVPPSHVEMVMKNFQDTEQHRQLVLGLLPVIITKHGESQP